MQTKKNRKTLSKRRPKVVGKLYATWCSHCKTLEPEWEKMKASITKLYKKGVQFVEIESENMESGLVELNKKLKTNVALQGGYPTLFKVNPGSKKVEYYGGSREARAMTEWCKGKNQTKRRID
jgi:thiol-disulfide isomerase/thioredoxin